VVVDWICLGLMVALVVDVFLGVFSRYVLHFRLHLLIDRFGPRLRHATDLAVGLLVLVFGAVLVAGGIAMYPVARRQVTDSLELSMLWFHGALPVGGALMILFSLPHLWRLFRAR
jgi:TRAP-type C4-dicarboxylate transport system permease small subunit